MPVRKKIPVGVIKLVNLDRICYDFGFFMREIVNFNFILITLEVLTVISNFSRWGLNWPKAKKGQPEPKWANPALNLNNNFGKSC